MGYFTKIEAENVQNRFVNLIGEKVAYTEAGSIAELTAIKIEDSGREILFMGAVEKGFVVKFVFGEKITLNTLDFCSINGLPPMYGTRHELSADDKKKLSTQQHMLGAWIHTEEKDYIKIDISAKEINIEILQEEEKIAIRFPNKTHWIKDVLVFSHNADYCITSANEKELNFGKLETSDTVNGVFLWMEKFARA